MRAMAVLCIPCGVALAGCAEVSLDDQCRRATAVEARTVNVRVLPIRNPHPPLTDRIRYLETTTDTWYLCKKEPDGSLKVERYTPPLY